MFTFPFTNFASAGYENVLSTTFNGVDEYIDCGQDASLKFEHTDSFSCSAWVKHDSLSGDQVYFCTLDPADGYSGIQFSKRATSSRIYIALVGNIPNPGGSIGIEGHQALALDTWHHVAFTYDGTGPNTGKPAALKLYLDGAVQTPTVVLNTSLSTSIISALPMNLGRRPPSLYYMNGHIDESAFWDKELSQSEITEIYNSGVPADLTAQSHAANLIAYWRMGDGDSATTITDNVGPNDGTLTNMDDSNYIEDVPS